MIKNEIDGYPIAYYCCQKDGLAVVFRQVSLISQGKRYITSINFSAA